MPPLPSDRVDAIAESAPVEALVPDISPILRVDRSRVKHSLTRQALARSEQHSKIMVIMMVMMRFSIEKPRMQDHSPPFLFFFFFFFFFLSFFFFLFLSLFCWADC